VIDTHAHLDALDDPKSALERARAGQLVGERGDEPVVAVEPAQLVVHRRDDVDGDHHRADRDLVAGHDLRPLDALAVLLRAVRAVQILDPDPAIVPGEARVLARQPRIRDLDVRGRGAPHDQRAPLLELRRLRAVAVIEHERRPCVEDGVGAPNGGRVHLVARAACSVTQILACHHVAGARKDKGLRAARSLLLSCRP